MNAVAPRSFGDLLRRHRLAAGLTQEALAEQAGLSSRSIQALEEGVSRLPRPVIVRQLAEALRLGPEDRAAFETAAQLSFPSGPDRPADNTDATGR